MIAMLLASFLAVGPARVPLIPGESLDGGAFVESADTGVGVRAMNLGDQSRVVLELAVPLRGEVDLVVELPSPAAVRPHRAWKGVPHPLPCPGIPTDPSEPEEADPAEEGELSPACHLAQELPHLGTRRYHVGDRLDAVTDVGLQTGLAPAPGGVVQRGTLGGRRLLRLGLSRDDLPLTTARSLDRVPLAVTVDGVRQLTVDLQLTSPWAIGSTTREAIADLKGPLLFRMGSSGDRVCSIVTASNFGDSPELQCFDVPHTLGRHVWGTMGSSAKSTQLRFLSRGRVARPVMIVTGPSGEAAWVTLGSEVDEEEKAADDQRLCRYSLEEVESGCFGAGCGAPADVLLERLCVTADGKTSRDRWNLCDLATAGPEMASRDVQFRLHPGAPPKVTGTCWSANDVDNEFEAALPLVGRPRLTLVRPHR